jgi:(1->4)-alpha-D-glucan 1-alpha-D-glucosylmutase
MSAIDQLADLLGIAAHVTDGWGVSRPVSAETKTALLAAMGIAVDDADAVARAIAARRCERWERILPPVHVVDAERAGAIEIALAADADTVSWTLRSERGVPERGTARWSELACVDAATLDGHAREIRTLPLGALAAGYYTLSVAAGDRGASTTVIAAPDQCLLPPCLRPRPDGRVWGLAVQLYGLRSARNWGIGDFTDLAALARRAAQLGAHALGLNPLHAGFPEAPERFGPYAPSSRLFLNHLYLDVERVDGFADCAEARRLTADPAFQARLTGLRAAALVDWPAVAAVKRPVLELLFRQFERAGDRGAFAAFRAAHGLALERHATFEALAEHFAAAPERPGWWRDWPGDYREPASAAVLAFAADHADRVGFFAWLQWQADRQLAAAHAAARRAGMAIGLYRDLAVGCDGGGAETWVEPQRCARGAALGAPPDGYNLHGQDWGLPPLAPEHLRAEAYRSFIELLRANMARAGALRIDHVFGLMRLYWVPAGRAPTDGSYVAYPFDDLLGVLKLESQRNRCLVVGEDLGTVPDGFRERCAAAGLLSYRVLYFERRDDGGFTAPADYPALALATASTHDLPTLSGWWHGSDLDQRVALGLYPSPETAARDRAARAEDRRRLADALAAQGLGDGLGDGAPDAPPVLAAHRYLARSDAALLMVQVEDVLGLVDQANLPGTTDQHPNWRRKLPVALERLLADDGPLVGFAAALAAERPRPPSATGALARPTATYRVQLNQDFTFENAAALVPYLAELGISHLYASPYLKARPASQHGYDITDHTRFNPELGGEAGFRALCAALERHAMGHVLDFVPNHMGIGGADNAWWLDVLEWGDASRYAAYFDIDWRPRFGATRGKLLLPILGDHYGDVLEAGELRLAFDAGAGSFSAWYAEHRLPICPLGYPQILEGALARAAAGDPDDPAVVELGGLIGDFAALDPRDGARADRPADALKLRLAGLVARASGLPATLAATLAEINGTSGRPDSVAGLHRILEAQSWRVAFWRVAGEINYRRFFDINELAGLRMENRALFDHAHRLVFELLDAGRLHGLRIDHIDGLADPAQYCRRIQERAGPELYLVVEKILAAHEHVPADWPITGTTGYDALNQINGVFVATAAERGLDRVYRRFTGRDESFEEILYGAKTQILEHNLSSELHVLALDLKRIADADPKSRDYTFEALRRALIETIAWFPVYRTYVTARELSAEDRQYIDWAIGRATKHSQLADLSIFEFLRAVLQLVQRPDGHTPAVLEFVRKFQQLTGPVMAKGCEDTAFYRYNRLLSLNEVGGDPRRFGLSIGAFHHLNERRLAGAPHGLVATATHDTKRGEDVRARLNLISEMPAAWGSRVTRWSRLNRLKRHVVDDRRAPSRNDEYLIYQTLVGSWPLALKDAVEPGAALAHYVERLVASVIKAVREAKERSSWTQPNQPYEDAVADFVRRILDAQRASLFLADFLPFQRRIAELGMVNGLAQLVLKLTVPGVPDIYQGTEFWDLSLVDPDNRTPVDYALRRRGLASNEDAAALLATWPDGRIKQRVLATLLGHRRAQRELYEDGTYQPLATTGTRAEHLVAFQRRANGRALVVVVPVLFARLIDADAAMPWPVGPAIWRDAAIGVAGARRWRDLFTGDHIETTERDGAPVLAAAAALARLPIACLEPAASG